MKKLLLLFTVSLQIQAFAQDHHSKFGIRVGAANTNFYGQDVDSKTYDGSPNIFYDSLRNNKWSFTGGFYINSILGDHFWLKTDVNFVNRGNTIKEKGISLRQNNYYVDIYPLSPTIHFKGAQLFAGPAFGFHVISSHQALDSLRPGKIVTINDGKLEDNNRFDIGMVAGFEYEIYFGLNIGVRYVRGFSSIHAPESGKPRLDEFNKALLITLGYSIGHHKKREHHD